MASAALLAASILGATASSSAADTREFEYTCKWPLVATQPLDVALSLDFPQSGQVGTTVAPVDVTAAFSAGASTPEFVSTLEAARLEGKATFGATVTYPSGQTVGGLKLPITLDPYTAPGQLPPNIDVTGKGRTPAIALEEGGTQGLLVTSLELNLRLYDAEGELIRPRSYGGEVVLDTDFDRDTWDIPCQLKSGESNVLAETFVNPPIELDMIAPSAVVLDPPTVKVCPSRSVTLRWKPSTDEAGGSGLKGYRLKVNGGAAIQLPATATSYTVSEPLGSELSYEISAVDNAGNETAPTSGEVLVPVAVCVSYKPILKAGAVTSTTVTLNWTPPVDPEGGPLRYNVYRNGTKVAGPLNGLTYTDTGLTANTQYSYAVEAVDETGLVGPKSDAVSATTYTPSTCPQGFACYDYGLKGKTTLKTITTGNLPLTGGINAQLKVSDGTFTADLTLANTSGRLMAAGFLPITAKVGFAPFGKTTGVLDDADATQFQRITTKSLVRIKVLEVKLFGSIPLAGGNNCQTKQLSEIDLKSTNAFDPLKGGTIAGTYKISDLNGCGVLNGLVSPLTAGGGNTISLDLTKKG